MKIDIFKEINTELKKQDRKSPWLADQVKTSPRNMYSLLNKRKDVYVGDLADISVALKKNFFNLYVPLIDAAINTSPLKTDENRERSSEIKSTLRIGIKYPESQPEDIGTFLKHVKQLAHEYGFEIE